MISTLIKPKHSSRQFWHFFVVSLWLFKSLLFLTSVRVGRAVGFRGCPGGGWFWAGPCGAGTAWTPGPHGDSTSLRILLLEKCLEKQTFFNFHLHTIHSVHVLIISFDPNWDNTHHFFLSYLSCKNSFSFCVSRASKQPSVLGSKVQSQVLLPT